MMAYYRIPGVVATLALIIYAMLVLSILMGLNANLTLPGIAGLILSVGMAVDANVIIFERIKEEIRTGKTIRASIEAGFRKAFRTIFDSNVTTLIAAGVLFYFGTGPIRGFAVTLAIGILTSMFTAIFITQRLLGVTLRATGIKNTKTFIRA
jgi:protein-export membrane protein SecD